MAQGPKPALNRGLPSGLNHESVPEDFEEWPRALSRHLNAGCPRSKPYNLNLCRRTLRSGRGR